MPLQIERLSSKQQKFSLPQALEHTIIGNEIMKYVFADGVDAANNLALTSKATWLVLFHSQVSNGPCR